MRNVLILGDSYSTYEGYIPEGYKTYYYLNGPDDVPAFRKINVEDTWWKQVLDLSGDNLLLNNSWSGSTIGYTGYDNVDCSKSNSFIYRFRQLRDSGFFKENVVDTVFLFGGTNDSWSDAPLGEIKLSDWEEQDLYFVLPAICYLTKSIKTELPDANIYFLINTDIKTEIADCIKQCCANYGVTAIELENIEKECGHPTIRGMKSISRQVLDKYKNNSKIKEDTKR